MGWLRKKFGEGSTYSGLSVVALVLTTIFPTYADAITAIAVALAGGAVVKSN